MENAHKLLTYPPPIHTWNELCNVHGREPTVVEFFKAYRELTLVETETHRIGIKLKLLRTLYDECKRGSIFSRCSWAPSHENVQVLKFV